MKRSFVLLAGVMFLFANVQQVSAQKGSDAYDEVYEQSDGDVYQTNVAPMETTLIAPESSPAVEESDEDDIQKLQSEISFNYRHPKGGSAGAYGIDLMFKHVVLGYEMFWMKHSPSDYRAFDIYAGANYRRFLGKWFYIEGRVMAGYKHVKMYGDKDGNGYLAFSPRVGLNLFHIKGNSHIALFGGYEVDFNEFKFKKGYIGHSFPFGIAMIF